MTITPNLPKIDSSLSLQETKAEFNWQNCWYPISFLQDLPRDRPLVFTLYDKPLSFFTLLSRFYDI